MSDFPTPPRGRHWANGGDWEPTRYAPGVASPAHALPRIAEPYPAEEDITETHPGLYRVDSPGRPVPPTRPDIPPDVIEDRGGGRDYRTGYGDDGQPIRGMNHRPRRAVPPGDSVTDLVVPRVYLEPDEVSDKLRARSWRWGIARDVVLVIVGGFLIFRWMLYPLWQLFAG